MPFLDVIIPPGAALLWPSILATLHDAVTMSTLRSQLVRTG
jgi:hypothetical protein